MRAPEHFGRRLYGLVCMLTGAHAHFGFFKVLMLINSKCGNEIRVDYCLCYSTKGKLVGDPKPICQVHIQKVYIRGSFYSYR